MARPSLPDIGLDKRSNEYKHFLDYLSADDSQQYDIVRDRWARLNWSLLDKCEQAISSLAKGESPNKISPLIISAGIGFDKLYSKRTETSKPLSFPAPLLAMVRKGLKLRSAEPVASPPTAELPRAWSDSTSPHGASPPPVGPLTGAVMTGEPPRDSLVCPGPDGGPTAPLTDPLVRQADPTQGGVAWAGPQAGERGHGVPLSRAEPRDLQLSQKQKKARPAGKTERAMAVRHERKARREAMVQAVRKQVREEVPYRHPPKPGGVV